MIWLLLPLAIIVVAIARALSSPPEMKMSKGWQRGEFYSHDRTERSKWASRWGC